MLEQLLEAASFTGGVYIMIISAVDLDPFHLGKPQKRFFSDPATRININFRFDNENIIIFVN